MFEVMNAHAFEVFFDGDCPLCRREISLLRRLDRAERIRFTDIAAVSFDPDELGLTLTRDQLMARIHGRRLPSGELVEGVDVFRELYSAIGWNGVVAATKLPGIRSLLDVSYRVFARNRLRWTGRCDDGQCEVKARTAVGGTR